MKVEVGLPHHVLWVLETQPCGHGAAAPHETAVDILEINAIRDVIEERAKKVALIGEVLLDSFPLGDIPKNDLNADHIAAGIKERRLDYVKKKLLTVRSLM